jgi:hypothetical protein
MKTMQLYILILLGLTTFTSLAETNQEREKRIQKEMWGVDDEKEGVSQEADSACGGCKKFKDLLPGEDRLTRDPHQIVFMCRGASSREVCFRNVLDPKFGRFGNLSAGAFTAIAIDDMVADAVGETEEKKQVYKQSLIDLFNKMYPNVLSNNNQPSNPIPVKKDQKPKILVKEAKDKLVLALTPKKGEASIVSDVKLPVYISNALKNADVSCADALKKDDLKQMQQDQNLTQSLLDIFKSESLNSDSNQNCPTYVVDRSQSYGHGIESQDENSLIANYYSLKSLVRNSEDKYGRGFVIEIRETFERRFGKPIPPYWVWKGYASDPELEIDRSRPYGHGIESMDEVRLIATFNSLRAQARTKYDRGHLAEIRELFQSKFGKAIPECPFWDDQDNSNAALAGSKKSESNTFLNIVLQKVRGPSEAVAENAKNSDNQSFLSRLSQSDLMVAHFMAGVDAVKNMDVLIKAHQSVEIPEYNIDGYIKRASDEYNICIQTNKESDCKVNDQLWNKWFKSQALNKTKLDAPEKIVGALLFKNANQRLVGYYKYQKCRLLKQNNESTEIISNGFYNQQAKNSGAKKDSNASKKQSQGQISACKGNDCKNGTVVTNGKQKLIVSKKSTTLFDNSRKTVAELTNKAPPLTSEPDPENPGFGKVTSACTICVNYKDIKPGQTTTSVDPYKAAWFFVRDNTYKTDAEVIVKGLRHGWGHEESIQVIYEYAYLKDYNEAQTQSLLDLYNQTYPDSAAEKKPVKAKSNAPVNGGAPKVLNPNVLVNPYSLKK